MSDNPFGLNDRMQWVYTVYLLGEVAREVNISDRGVMMESYSIAGEDVTPEIIGLTRRSLIDMSKTMFKKATLSKSLQASVDRAYMSARGVIGVKPKCKT